MIKPVILTNPILTAAEEIATYYREWWWSCGQFTHIADANLVSPVDGHSRQVRFHLTFGFRNKAKTVCGLRAPGHRGDIVGDGNTVVLNRNLITDRDLFLPILLHEICHAVDPVFEEEWHALNAPGRQHEPLEHEEACRFLHEQRAFTGMWIGCLRDELVDGRYQNEETSIAEYRSASPEFNWFCNTTPDLMDQTRSHIRAIVTELQEWPTT
jgi:hypothetical protein